MADAKILQLIVDLKDQATEKIKSLGGSLKDASGSMALAGGALTGLAIKLGKDAVDAAADAERGISVLETTLKSTGGKAGITKDEVLNLAGSLAKVTAIGDDTTLAGQNMLLTFTNIGKEVFPSATETMLDMATAMNQGIAPSAEQLKGTAIQLGKALNDPVKGISALSKVGVSFTEQQKAQIEAMMAAGDAAGAQNVILKELSVEFGGQARATLETYSGRVTQMKENWGEVQEVMGQAILPILEKVGQAIGKVVTFLQEHEGIAKAIIPTLLAVGGALMSVKVAISAISAVQSAASGIGSIAKMFASIPLPVLAVIAVLALVAGAVYLVVKNWDWIKAKAIEIWTAIKDFFVGIWDGIKGIFQGAFDFVKNAWEIFIDAVFSQGYNRIEGILLGIAEVFDYIFGTKIGDILWKFIEFVHVVWDAIKLSVVVTWTAIKDFFISIWNGIKFLFELQVMAIKFIVTTVFDAISDAIIAVWTGIKNFFTTLWDGIKFVFNAAFDFIKMVIQNNINFFKNIIEVGMNAIKLVFTSIWEGIKSVALGVWEFLKTTIMNALTYIANIFISAKETISAPFRAIWEGMLAVVNSVVDKIKSTVSGVVDFVTGIWDKISGIWNKIFKKGQDAKAELNITTSNSGLTGHRAAGGFVRAGGSYIVGERGQEVFTPSTSGRIHANGGGGITVNVTGNSFQGTGREMVDQISEILMRKLKANLLV